MKWTLLNTVFFAIIFSTACSSGEKGNKSTKTSTNQASPSDNNSDEWIMSEIRKKYPDISKDDVCIERPRSFVGLACLGMFAHDRGCSGVFGYYGQEKGRLMDLSVKVLNDNQWSDRTKRSELALAYTKEVIQVWEGVMTSTTDNFEKSEQFEFSEPSVALEDGEVTVTCWVQLPAGMAPEDKFHHLTVVYGNDGMILSKEVSNGFTIDY